MRATIRLERIQEPFIQLPLRHADGTIETVELWREDRLDPGDGSHYLVIDFADQMSLVPGTDRYEQPTGGIALELQRIDAETGEGMSNPHTRYIDPVIPDQPDPESERSSTGGISYDTHPLTLLEHLPVSTRRPT
jgi:hypothetical protein